MYTAISLVKVLSGTPCGGPVHKRRRSAFLPLAFGDPLARKSYAYNKLNNNNKPGLTQGIRPWVHATFILLQVITKLVSITPKRLFFHIGLLNSAFFRKQLLELEHGARSVRVSQPCPVLLA